MPEHVLTPEVEIIVDAGLRGRWTAVEKVRIVEETLNRRFSISVVVRRKGLGANLLHRWRRLMLEGGAVPVSDNNDVTNNRVVREMEARIRQRGRKTMEVEILKEALDRARQRTDVARLFAAEGRFPVSVVAKVLGVSRSRRPGWSGAAASALLQGR